MPFVMLSPSTAYTPEYGSSTPIFRVDELAGLATAGAPAGAEVAAAAGFDGGAAVVGAQPASQAPPATTPAVAMSSCLAPR